MAWDERELGDELALVDMLFDPESVTGKLAVSHLWGLASVTGAQHSSRGCLGASYQVYFEIVSIMRNSLFVVKSSRFERCLCCGFGCDQGRLTSSTYTTGLHLDENIIVTQFWKRNLDNGKLGRLRISTGSSSAHGLP